MKLILAGFVVLLLLISPIYADDIFGLPENISPPSLPATIDEDRSLLIIFLQDTNQEIISNVHADIRIQGTDYERRKLQYLSDDFLTLGLNDGIYTISVSLDQIDTSGFDYYSTAEVTVSGDTNTTFTFLPVGSLRGVVYDKNNNLVSDADLKVECNANYGDLTNKKTDDFGSFSFDALPIGECSVYAKKRGISGDSEILSISQGSVQTVEIILNRGNTLNLITIIVVVIVLIIILFFTFYKLKPEKEVRNKRADDLMKTFNEKEKAVVELLLKEKKLYQNKIVHTTGIPKTSIVRVFQSLESKKVISIEKIGKAKIVKLTDWFLEKE
jgi:uncharacterized membrane protein